MSSRPEPHPSRPHNHPPLPPGSTGWNESSPFSTRGQRLSQVIQNNVRRASSQTTPHRISSQQATNGWYDEEGDVESPRRTPRTPSYQKDAERSRRTSRANVSGDGRDIDLEGPGMLDAESDDGVQEVLRPDLPKPPSDFPFARWATPTDERERQALERKTSILVTPQMRSQRLIGNSNPRYRWEQYYKREDELKKMKKSIRRYYERNNYLIMQYLYVDKLLDSSLPHNLIQEYGQNQLQSQSQSRLVDIPETIGEEPSILHASTQQTASSSSSTQTDPHDTHSAPAPHKIKRTKSLYRFHNDENTPLLDGTSDAQKVPTAEVGDEHAPAAFQLEESGDNSARIVTVAIYVNLAANTLLLILKIIVTVLTSSLSVLASLVDAALDFLSTAIVWSTTRMIADPRAERFKFPVGRHRFEPLGVLIFSVVMITSFFQVAIEALNRLMGPDHEVVVLGPAAIAIMSSTVVVKALCWFWCRLVRNSSVQALAQDAVTDVIFNSFSIVFPLVGYFFRIWWFDPLGGLLLSLYVIVTWSLTTRTHILNLVGQTASADERNILLYLTMRFAKCIRKIQNIAAYHVGDKLNVEVDIVLDEEFIGGGEGDHAGLTAGARALRDIHDLGESLQYVLESVPGVERAFVHSDYWEGNLPSHMNN